MCHIFWHSVEIFSRLRETLYCIGTSCAGIPPWKHISNWQVLEQISTPYMKNIFVAQRFLGTQLFRTTQMCQGSTCHVVAQHGDISKLNKALLLTWEVCATIAIKTSKKISMLFQKTQGKEGKPRKATFVAQRFLGHNCWLPRCAHVRLPRYMPKRTYMSIRTAARDPDSGSGSTCLSSSTACLVQQAGQKQLYWLGKTVQICKFNIWYLLCHAGDEMSNCTTKTCRTKLLGTP